MPSFETALYVGIMYIMNILSLFDGISSARIALDLDGDCAGYWAP